MEAEVAVVTGGAGGLGRLITCKLARQGFVVAIADTDREAASQLSAELADVARSGRFIETDASDADAIRSLMAQAASLGAVKVLINNAGGWFAGPQFPESDQWPRCIDLNLVMPMLAAQLAVPLMINRGGSIVNVSSAGGLGLLAYGSPEYGAANAGLIRFTASVADWVDRYHIRVNCVVPMEVLAELDAGQVFPLSDADGTTRLVEVYRADLPWSRRPPPGFDWTSDEEMTEVLRRATPPKDSTDTH